MNKKKVAVVSALLVAAAGGSLWLFCPGLLRSVLPSTWCDAMGVARLQPGSYIGSTVKGEEWRNLDALQNKLTGMIDSRLIGVSPQQVTAFMKDPENRLILQQFALVAAEKASAEKREAQQQARNKDLENLRKQLENNTRGFAAGAELPPKVAALNKKIQSRIKAIESENAAAHSLDKIAATKQGAEFMEKFGNNLDWLEQINSTGERTNPGEVVSMLMKAAAKNPELMFNRMERDIATATAMEFARSGWAQQDALDRITYFTNSWKAGRLNKVFNKLPFWQRRIVCGLKGKGEAGGAGGNDMAGSVDSMKYSLNNVHLPAYRYVGSCWQAPYRLHNVYGESIHGSGYHQTFMDCYGRNFNELTRTVGGVCGGLSHYGATTATANGVPALTAGEPGHCAYIVLVGDKWTPAYSLSWERGLHWQVFANNHKYSSLHMATQLFSPQEKERTDLSFAMLNLGHVYSRKDPSKAYSLFTNAASTQPLNYYAWRDFARFLAEAHPSNGAVWTGICEQLHKQLVPTHAEMAAELLKTEIYPNLKKAVSASHPGGLNRVVMNFWNNVRTMGPDENWDKGNQGRWNVEELCRAQLNLLGINPQKDPAVQDFFRSLMTSVAGNPQYSPVALSWGNSLLEKMSPELGEGFMAAMLSGVSHSGAGSDEEREKLLVPVILASEKAGDTKSFQSIGHTLPEKYRKPQAKLPAFEAFPETLVSQGGVLQASSTSRFDKPCEHWGVLEPMVGGSFHTGKDKDAWVKVTLPKQANLTGVVIITTTGNLQRLDNMKVQVSETGEDNDWTDIHDFGPCKGQVLRVDLNATRPLAKYVRILRVGGPEFFHLRGIFIYGKPAA